MIENYAENPVKEFDDLLLMQFRRCEGIAHTIIRFSKNGIDDFPLSLVTDPLEEFPSANRIARYQELLAGMEAKYKSQLLYSRNGCRLDVDFYKNLLHFFITEYKTALLLLISLHKEIISGIEAKRNKTAAEKKMLEVSRQEMVLLQGDADNTNNLAGILEHLYLELKAQPGMHDAETFQSSWKWPQKIQFILGREDRLLSLNEILDHIIRYEPSLIKENVDRRDLNKSLSGLLRYYTKEKMLVREESPFGEFFLYGKSQWVGHDGKLLEKYQAKMNESASLNNLINQY